MTTSPDENRPYSTSYGFGSTATESIASSGSRQLRETGRRIDQRARAELQAGLTRPSALDADAARHFDDAGQQAQRRLQAAARRKLIELAAANRVALGERPLAPRQHVGRHHVDGLRDAGNRQIERQIRRLSRRDLAVDAALVEPRQRREDPVFARRQIGKAEVTVLARRTVARPVGRTRP